jgi:type IV pilus assembly protein PilC
MNNLFTQAHPMKEAKKELLFSELLSLLSSGLDFSRAFQLLIGQENEKNTKQMLEKLYSDVVSGAPLWQALQQSGRFPALDCGVVRIGEQTGRLAEALDFLADYYHKRIAQKRMVSSAVSYPIIILCTAVVVVAFMLAFIVPMFEQVYSRMGGELPAMTRRIIALSRNFPLYAGIATAIFASIAFALYSTRHSDEVRRATAWVMLHTPLAGAALRKNHQAHFCKLLYLLTSSGVPLLHGLKMLRTIITFYPYQQSLDSVAGGLSRGELFSAGLERYPHLYEKRLTTLLRVGEETNRLPQMLQKQGEDLTKELEYRLRQLGSMLEPLLILLVGILVAVILISMYLPMFRLGGVMG